MKKIISVLCAAVILLSCVSVSAFAITEDEANSALAVQNEAFNNIVKNRLDVDGSGKITAADARLALLISAGIVEDGANSKNADIDGDGKVTSIDARIYLRLAAGLENVIDYYTDEEMYNYFLAIVNSVKPNSHKYFKSTVETTDKVNYTDSKGVISSLNKQFGYYSAIEPEMEGFDFAEEIKAIEGDKYYTDGSTYLSSISATARTYPVEGNEYACIAQLADIKDIVYKTNQTFTYNKYSAKNQKTAKVIATQTVTGLDSLTIYLKDDAAVSITGDIAGKFDNTYAAKALNILDEDAINDVVGSYSLDDSFNGLDDFGTCDIKITPKTLQYKDCYVTVYFDPATGKPVGTVNNLHYAIDMNMDMFIDMDDDYIETGNGITDAAMKLALLNITGKNGGKILYIDGDFDVKNEMSVNTTYYFYENNAGNSLTPGSLI